MASQIDKTGFTLIEVMIAVVFVGLAITALMTASSTFTFANGVGADLSTAEFLIEQIRELTALADYGDLYAFDGKTYCPPISASKDMSVLNDFAAFSQQVTVENISRTNFEQVVADNGSNFIRVTVKIFLNSKEISSARWIRAKY